MFNNRGLIIVLSVLLTLFMGYQVLQMKPEASFLRMIPTYHPYIKNYIAHQDDLKGLGNVVRVCVETAKGDIFTREYLEVLKSINDEKQCFSVFVYQAEIKYIFRQYNIQTNLSNDIL